MRGGAGHCSLIKFPVTFQDYEKMAFPFSE